MAMVANAIPNEVFSCKDADTLLIMQRRISDSDLKDELYSFNEIFSKKNGADISDIVKSMISYVRVKVLMDVGTDEFDGKAYRELFKECKVQIARTNNVMRLTKASAVTALDYQKEHIELIIQKNEAFIRCLEEQMASVEKKLERLPKEEVKSEAEEVKQPEEMHEKSTLSKESAFDYIARVFHAKKDRQELDERLKTEEKKKSRTYCEEIPFYDKSIVLTECYACKDIPTYSLMKRKNNVYFGLSKNVDKNVYDNKDGSLVELTKASDELLQFMTEDLLSGEYSLSEFSQEEKDGMQMYFDFMSRCFEQHIGVTLTVREYLKFKEYYNRLVSRMFELEQKRKEDYYRALALADKYLAYMRSYNLECGISKEDIIVDIISNDVEGFRGDLDLILENHIVDLDSKTDIEELRQLLLDFYKEEKSELQEVKESSIETEQTPDQIALMYGQQVIPNLNQQNIMQIVVQILDAKRDVIDEAIYAGDNISQALYDFETKDACIKRLGFRNNGVDVFYKEEVNR